MKEEIEYIVGALIITIPIWTIDLNHVYEYIGFLWAFIGWYLAIRIIDENNSPQTKTEVKK